jgi:hypothetical protein
LQAVPVSFLTTIKITKLRVPSSKYDAGDLPPDSPGFVYGLNTSIYTQRAHLGRVHIREWVTAAEEGNWIIPRAMAEHIIRHAAAKNC